MTRLFKVALGALVAGGLLVMPPQLLGGHPDTSKLADGMMMHLGVVHSKVLAANPASLPKDHPIHPGKNVYHVLVSVYDQESGQNITDAKVKASVVPMTAGGIIKTMAQMDTSGFITYCNYFKMQPQVTYNIDVSVQRPGSERIAKASFTHQPFAD